MKWYKYDIRDLTDEEYQTWYSLMSSDKQKRVANIRHADDKKRTVSGEMLSRKAISEWCGVTPQSIVFDTKEHGKPYAKDLSIEFSISHSGDIVVCAVDDKPIGIDIEQIRPMDLKIAKRICTDEELLYLFGHAAIEQDFCYTEDIEILTRFFMLWTAKEAYGKLVGNGLASISKPSKRETKTCIIEKEYVVS
ncbi:MAG: 4'-phosphopantetheinyl transferase superfamily protein, partial [Clostridia bacterium]|nr:4'-phosphopantetheinyl transferase superfamily protein [Clostridia bacterium]